MKESVFIKQNLSKWRSYETKITDPQQCTPDELAEMYTELTSDLAFAQTQFPDTHVTQLLNDMTLKLHGEIYRGRQEKWSRLWTFWTDDVPLAVYNSRKSLLASLIVFLIFVAIGVISTYGDSTFSRLVLGDSYIDMTIDNINQGHPTGVYDNEGEWLMFFMIMFNNLIVGAKGFALGVLTPIGTGYYLMVNGVMFGTFMTLFAQHGVFGESLLAVMQHGTLELSTMVISGGAGFVLGTGWMFPGTYSRMVSFRRSAKEALKIAMSVMPVTITAAFIESFITRHTEAPLFLRLLVIIASATFIVFYYIVLPYKKAHKPHETSQEAI